jgi:(p)ppGpp synthase/HD superfamily hydrolase
MISNPTTTQLTDRFAHAFAYAFSLHRHQRRKVRPIPYIAHLMSVAALVLEDGGSEDEAVAALLHDAVEDQGGEATRSQILQQFGPEVVAIVDACTEPPRQPGQGWRQHKQRYLNQIQQADESAQRVILADKAHNLRSLLINLDMQGDSIWGRFAGTKEDYLWLYQSLGELFEMSVPGSLINQVRLSIQQLLKRA